MKTIIGLFKDDQSADFTIRELEKAGFGENDFGLIARNKVLQRVDREEDKEEGTIQSDHKLGAAGGATVGGLTGLVAGLTALTIPGIGPILAAGMVAASTGLGATAGGLLGLLTSTSISEEDAHAYAEGLKRGGILVVVQADERREADVKAIMRKAGALEIDSQRKEWEAEGWTGFEREVLPGETYPRL